jgi:DMSO reductase anchor subunit
MDTNQQTNTPDGQQDLLEQIAPDYKLYSLNQMVGGSIFGGPIAGAYMIANNIKHLNASIPVWKVWAAVFGVVFISFIPDALGYDSIPNIAYNLLYCLTVYWLAKYFIGDQMQSHQDMGGLYWGFPRVLSVVLISIVAFVIIIFLVLIMTDYDGFMELFA